jgi:hypothetical protein
LSKLPACVKKTQCSEIFVLRSRVRCQRKIYVSMCLNELARPLETYTTKRISLMPTRLYLKFYRTKACSVLVTLSYLLEAEMVVSTGSKRTNKFNTFSQVVSTRFGTLRIQFFSAQISNKSALSETSIQFMLFSKKITLIRYRRA